MSKRLREKELWALATLEAAEAIDDALDELAEGKLYLFEQLLTDTDREDGWAGSTLASTVGGDLRRFIRKPRMKALISLAEVKLRRLAGHSPDKERVEHLAAGMLNNPPSADDPLGRCSRLELRQALEGAVAAFGHREMAELLDDTAVLFAAFVGSKRWAERLHEFEPYRAARFSGGPLELPDSAQGYTYIERLWILMDTNPKNQQRRFRTLLGLEPPQTTLITATIEQMEVKLFIYAFKNGLLKDLKT